jgi:addiction module HigA family antidote
MVKIGKKLKKLREQLGMSQQKLARLLGVSRPTISQIEHGERRIYAEELVKLSEIFGFSVDSLLNLEEQPEVICWFKTEYWRNCYL